MKKYTEWVYGGEQISSLQDLQEHFPNACGFVYKLRLLDLKTKNVTFEYIGKKNLFTKRKRVFGKKEKSSITDKRLKTYEYVIKESDWKTYLSSNKFIKLNSHNFFIEREILLTANTDNDLTYQEAKQIMCSGALEDCKYLNDGIKIVRYGKNKQNERAK